MADEDLNIDDEGYFTYYGPGKIDGFGVNKEDGVWFFVGGCYFKGKRYVRM